MFFYSIASSAFKVITPLIQLNKSHFTNFLGYLQQGHLQTIPGIGRITAIAMLAEVPDFSSFNDARQLAAYAGLTPKQRTSGSSLRGKARLSKIGSANLRKALYFPAISAKTHNSLLKVFADKLKSKGKSTMVIIGAIMRKLLHIIFGVIKHQTPFNPAILA